MPQIILGTEVQFDLVGHSIEVATFSNKDDVVVIGQQSKRTSTYQVLGFVPFVNCTTTDCREPYNPCCYRNTVFGQKGIETSTYENDISSFLVNFLALLNPYITFRIQKLESGSWVNKDTLSDDTYGTYYGLGSIAGHNTYIGYKINWGYVLNQLGVGVYRIKFIANGSGISTCMVSEAFNLLEFNCNQAHGTVKFESSITGKIGDKRIDYMIHDMTGVYWEDSIRVNGFFGYEKVGEYRTVQLEWGNPYHGKIEKIRDEAVQSFEFLMRQDTPQFIHTRLMTYGLMADYLKVSDYNINNSDYDIRQMLVVRDSGYEPTYFNKNNRRIAGVKVTFKRGVQSVIKSNC